MGMGNYPCHADSIEESFIESQCPELLDEFKVALDETDIDFDTFCKCMEHGEWDESSASDEDIKRVCTAYEKLQKHFNQMTDLDLDCTYTCDAEMADRGCEVIGGIWCVGGVYEKTAAGKKWDKKITNVGWTVFG
jgi:hypothetical protein